MELHRLFRFPGGDFSPSPAQYRLGRLDPPLGRSDEYGVLYTSDAFFTAALEFGALLQLPTDPPTYERVHDTNTELPPIQHVILRSQEDLKFIDFTDHATASVFGLDLKSVLDDVRPWREAAAKAVGLLREAEKAAALVGISYASKRNPAATNYALLDGKYQYYLTAQNQGAIFR
ncbi:hypothetical protein HNP33_003997 [Comamonas odontotermitis]|uniref:RES domain-containing protein n=1 Tax=Comamonas odontotermitis TaxID=379895 RepID=A0ABR6RL26_9BURK|nr:RES family NAD+ phosphorylase [Comamonas odontotermitis]MBB6579878.1 hypothetical protein [Comamonas odontotermitis]